MYTCDQCVYKAIWETHLRRYIESVHGGVQYTCNICDCKTAQKGHLNEHLEFVHGDVPEYETVYVMKAEIQLQH